MAATNVKAFGFEIALSNNIEFDEFYHEIVRKEDQELKFREHTNLIYTDIRDNYIIGAIITLRDDKRSISSFRDDEGNLIISKAELAASEQTTEASLFCINPISKKGLIYSYLTSTSVIGLYRILFPVHNSLRSEKIKEKSKELSELGKKGNKLKQAKKEFNGRFEVISIQSYSDIKRLVNEFSEIREAEFKVTESLAPSSMFTALDPFIANSSYKMRLSNDFAANLIRGPLITATNLFSKANNARALKLIGRGLDGEHLSMLLGENKDEYLKLKYDRYVELLPEGNVLDYKNCGAMTNLLKVAKEKDQIFGKQPQNSDWILECTKLLKGW